LREGAKRNFARELRGRLTDAEQRLWRFLRRRQLKGCRFRRQFPLGPYIVDFVCLERGLVVEVDGGQHDRCGPDAVREDWLCRHGFVVLRFWNNDVLARTDAVLAEIARVLGAGLSLAGLPQQWEGV
jgi:very-short-patch-repair endonuclease